MTDFVIEKGVPIPSAHTGPHKTKYPWRELEVGDSFFVPGTTASKFRSGVGSMTKRFNIAVTCRSVTENGVEGVRVWRIE